VRNTDEGLDEAGESGALIHLHALLVNYELHGENNVANLLQSNCEGE
jgi:hypothetical protein